jgi:hypothetical protein
VAFDAQVWKAQRGTDALQDENPRAAMVSELKREHLVPGKTRDDVLELLGPPDFEEGGVDFYELGRSTWGISFERLALEYAGDELVEAFVTRT